MTVMPREQTVIRRCDGMTAQLEEDAIVVRDRRGREVLSVGANGVRLIAVDGDLTLAAPNGRVVIEAGTDVDLSVAGRLMTQAEQVVNVVGRWELEAERLVERASDVYRQVDGLLHSRAGRVRQLVDGAHQLVARRASIACDEDVSIDGNRVLLG